MSHSISASLSYPLESSAIQSFPFHIFTISLVSLGLPLVVLLLPALFSYYFPSATTRPNNFNSIIFNFSFNRIFLIHLKFSIPHSTSPCLSNYSSIVLHFYRRYMTKCWARGMRMESGEGSPMRNFIVCIARLI